ncbi:MAG TPA: FAD-dependent oxidoreductase, partial [Candidatus Binatia bacterium]
MKPFDVAIVGAGPAGSSAAVFLARRGYSVALLDKAVFPRAKLCGDFLNPACWSLFDRLGIRDTVASLEHQEIGSFLLSTPTAEAVVPFPRHNGRRVFGFGLKRSLLDDLLLRLAIKEGVAVEQGSRLSGLERAGAAWRLKKDSSRESLRARLLIGADGRNSWVANRLGLAAPGDESGKYVAFQLNLSECAGLGGDIQIHLFPGGYAGLAGVGGRSANLCFAVERKIVRQSPSFEAVLERRLAKNP